MFTSVLVENSLHLSLIIQNGLPVSFIKKEDTIIMYNYFGFNSSPAVMLLVFFIEKGAM